MKKTNYCKRCKKEFITHRNSPYCNQKCYLLARWGTAKCQNCGKDSKIRYCSLKCRKEYCNKNDYKIFKKSYHWNKKLEILKELGNKCIKCGNEDLRVLDINHKDRKKKERPKHSYTWSWRIKEWRKNMKNLELLCANCHRIHTWEQMNYGIGKPVIPRPNSPPTTPPRHPPLMDIK